MIIISGSEARLLFDFEMSITGKPVFLLHLIFPERQNYEFHFYVTFSKGEWKNKFSKVSHHG